MVGHDQQPGRVQTGHVTLYPYPEQQAEQRAQSALEQSAHRAEAGCSGDHGTRFCVMDNAQSKWVLRTLRSRRV